MPLHTYLQAVLQRGGNSKRRQKCDIFLLDEVEGSSKLLSALKIFDQNAHFVGGKSYLGFLGLNLKRIAAVGIVADLRSNGIRALNVPVAYRDQELLSDTEALALATKHAKKKGDYRILSMSPNANRYLNRLPHPMFLFFHFERFARSEPREGDGIGVVDRLDGHIWDSDEMQEYQYDFNNLL